MTLIRLDKWDDTTEAWLGKSTVGRLKEQINLDVAQLQLGQARILVHIVQMVRCSLCCLF